MCGMLGSGNNGLPSPRENRMRKRHRYIGLLLCPVYLPHQVKTKAMSSYPFIVPTFSDWQISLTFPVFFTVFQYFLKFLFKVWYHIFLYYWLTNFPGFSSIFSIFQYNFVLIFAVLWVKFPDFSSLSKIPWLFPGWKMLSHFFLSEWGPCPDPYWSKLFNKVQQFEEVAQVDCIPSPFHVASRFALYWWEGLIIEGLTR